jgi:probable rRNA maturation factor
MRTRTAAGRGAGVEIAAAGRGPGVEIALLNPNRYSEAAARRLRPWLGELLAALAPAGCGSLGVRFAGDRAMRQANSRFRGKDQTTDVLSFPGGGLARGHATTKGGASGGGDPAGGDGHLGDILISVPAARRQAAEAGRATEREIRVLLLHGVLHCLGHDHETDGGEMERLERRLRRRWIGPSLANPRRARAGGHPAKPANPRAARRGVRRAG